MREAERVEFEWIFRSTYRSVLRTTYLVLHDRGRAEEVTQDAFLRLYERWRGVAAIEHPEAWVRRVAVRAAVRSAQRTRLRTAPPPDEDQATWDEIPDVDLARAVASLAPQQRAAVALHYLDDLKVDDVARHLGVSTSTVKQHLFRARTRLATMLSENVEVAGDVD
ncbi:RNA polymerase sigma factor [Nocardioides sp.]|uniref:RNA polymerase sigma factor n=1 Tax=Nocardioides sp. TaxID=35761 RepID=UPI002ED05DF1